MKTDVSFIIIIIIIEIDSALSKLNYIILIIEGNRPFLKIFVNVCVRKNSANSHF